MVNGETMKSESFDVTDVYATMLESFIQMRFSIN